MNYYYFAVTDEISCKYFSYVKRVRESSEIFNALSPLSYTDKEGNKYAVTHHWATALPTLSKAKEVVKAWNETYIRDNCIFKFCDVDDMIKHEMLDNVYNA